MIYRTIILSSCLFLAAGCTHVGKEDAYIVEGRFIKECKSDHEYIIECDAAPSFNPIELDKYVRKGAAALALQKGYTHFTCKIESRLGPPLIRPVYYVGLVSLYNENAPDQAINAKKFLELNPVDE